MFLLSLSDLLRLALDVHSKRAGVDVRPEIARTKFKLAQVLEDAGSHQEAHELRTDAQMLRKELKGRDPSEDDSEKDFDELVAYFYR